ncbi:putative acyl-CoA transferase/carnitine dehydratase [uncultured Mycobacterium sp.]|uniref:Putative acyl-CoA transferase/carnitine dehydratase n=1 Tax=uncultured Mycobacterium sp. TaxID=171292 RepID=A0A1Y5NXG6_9MYCO|nr:putative acyl-CoA transferase/carnitine dehydratase [uncultured Mycobacterium sp.]
MTLINDAPIAIPPTTRALPLDGVRVVDLSSSLGGAYCTKLLTDLGADGVAIRGTVGGSPVAGSSELDDYLRTSQSIAMVDDEAASDDLIADAHIVVDDALAGRIVHRNRAVTVLISPLGGGGPDSLLDLPEDVLQARSGSMAAHGHKWKPPLRVGGRLGEWTSGAYAALGAVTAWYRRGPGTSETVDVSVLEAIQLTFLSAPTLSATFPGGAKRARRFVMVPSIHRCADGEFVGLSTFSPQQWFALLDVVGRPDLKDDGALTVPIVRIKRRTEVLAVLDSYLAAHTVGEAVAAFEAARVPVVHVGPASGLLQLEHARARSMFTVQPGSNFLRPRSPFRFSSSADRPMEAPRAFDGWSRPAAIVAVPDCSPPVPARPLAGLRVIDLTQFWAGPYATSWLAAMGADVIKIESSKRPDSMRYSSFVAHDDPEFVEKSAMFHMNNLGKRSVCLDLVNEDDLRRVKALIADADIVAENFTPRVMDRFGLGWDGVHALNPRAIYLRMPAFGLDGPLRDRPGFATTMEQLTGLAWVTGYSNEEPIAPGGIIDPLSGVHAAIAVIAALDRRRTTGAGTLIEVSMLEVTAAITAEQIIDHQVSGKVHARHGERGTYECAGDDTWITVDDEHDPLSARERAEWCARREPEVALAELRDIGIAAAIVAPPWAPLDDPQLAAREFFTSINHRIVGEHQYPGFPMRMSRGQMPWWSTPAPTLGEHTDEVLATLDESHPGGK